MGLRGSSLAAELAPDAASFYPALPSRALRYWDLLGLSVIGLGGGLVRTALLVLTIGLLALIVAFVPRRRDVVTVAALGAAVLIALQLGVTHWFYLYIVWFFPLVMVAVLGFYPERIGALEVATRSEEPAPAPALSPEPASARSL